MSGCSGRSVDISLNIMLKTIIIIISQHYYIHTMSDNTAAYQVNFVYKCRSTKWISDRIIMTSILKIRNCTLNLIPTLQASGMLRLIKSWFCCSPAAWLYHITCSTTPLSALSYFLWRLRHWLVCPWKEVKKHESVIGIFSFNRLHTARDPPVVVCVALHGEICILVEAPSCTHDEERVTVGEPRSNADCL